MATKNIYLLDPYNDVIKINAISDSVFRLDLNKSIVYTRQQIWDKIDAIAPLNQWEDEITRISRWAVVNQNNIADLRKADINIANLIQWYNSYSDNICGGISTIIRNLFYHYLGVENVTLLSGGDENGGHSYEGFTAGSIDHINKVPFYKGRYVGANFTELSADGTLYYEPLRAIVLGWHHTKTAYTSYVSNAFEYDNIEIPPAISTVDNVYMRMPGGSSFIFPVKSANVPKTEVGADIASYGNLILTTPTGVTGNVEMPFNLLQVTGTGTITVDGESYTLPDDEAALKVVLQTTEYAVEKWHHSFVINTNTGGLEAEFLVNYHNIKLFHNNVVDYTITSGAISFERVKTTIPIPTHILSVNIGDSGSWTTDYNTIFTKSKSLKVPNQFPGWGHRSIDFLPNNYGKFAPKKIYQNYTANSLSVINAGVAVIDQCFASRLTPKDETFTDILELTFTSVDGSSTYYTIDGTTPDATKTLYTAPFTISATTTVKWINIKEDYADSHVNTRVITKS